MACILYSQGNNDWFPGLDASGNHVAVDVEQRWKTLLDASHFSGAYLVSPSEIKKVWSAGPLTTANYSYAALQLPATGDRLWEWRKTDNKNAPVITDRLVVESGRYRSVHTNPRGVPGEWRGHIAWNDNHVTFESDFTVDTNYAGTAHTDDNIFTPAGPDDAYMVYSGNE